MSITTINARDLQKMFLAGAKNLQAKSEWINELNVFPVPDGDTGTNMTMTIMSAAKEVASLENPDMEQLAKAISSGSLRGARGNSGVILSQLFRGFTKEMCKQDKLDVFALAACCEKAVQTAYKAVMKPKEGTILTVAKAIIERSVELLEESDDLEYVIGESIKAGHEMLLKTPDMLPVLKQAGVVDSGGQGLMEVLDGAYEAFLGKEIDLTIDNARTMGSMPKVSAEDVDTANITFGYCTEFIILLKKEFTQSDELQMKDYLTGIGDSLVVVADEEIVKVHVHTNDPGLAIQKALTYGELSNMKIDNMRLEHQEKVIKDAYKLARQQKDGIEENEGEAYEQKQPEEEKEYGFIAVSVGIGMNAIFRNLGADYVIEGGQTMNPSTEDILNAIEKINAKNIFVLPNNKNIVLAANQARDLTEDKNIIVIPSKTAPQGMAAMINFMPDQSPEENEAAMTEEMDNVKTGQVTYAVRDTEIDNKVIKQGNMMGIGDSGILSVGSDKEQVLLEMLEQLQNEESEIISLYYGAEVEEKEAQKLADEIRKRYPDCDVDLMFGGQPVYYYIISVE